MNSSQIFGMLLDLGMGAAALHLARSLTVRVKVHDARMDGHDARLNSHESRLDEHGVRIGHLEAR